LQTVLFWNPTQPFRLVGAYGFQQIICIPTNKRSINEGGR
jgi:hypothetical protein